MAMALLGKQTGSLGCRSPNLFGYHFQRNRDIGFDRLAFKHFISCFYADAADLIRLLGNSGG
jgi:hypothetical protein